MSKNARTRLRSSDIFIFSPLNANLQLLANRFAAEARGKEFDFCTGDAADQRCTIIGESIDDEFPAYILNTPVPYTTYSQPRKREYTAINGNTRKMYV